jgi:hypothetical protein
VGSNPRPRDYEVAAFGRYGPVRSDSSETLSVLRPVVSVWSGGVGLVCGIKRGISRMICLVRVRFGGPSYTFCD